MLDSNIEMMHEELRRTHELLQRQKRAYKQHMRRMQLPSFDKPSGQPGDRRLFTDPIRDNGESGGGGVSASGAGAGTGTGTCDLADTGALAGGVGGMCEVGSC